MKTKYLLPSSWRMFGVILTLICVPLTLWAILGEESVPFHTISTNLRFKIPNGYYPDNIFTYQEDGTIGLQIIDELLGLGNIIGLFTIGFSKLKVEDERIMQIRLESLQWGIYANYLFLALCILLVYGGHFFSIMIYNIFTPLLIFVARFYWLLNITPLIEAKQERSLV